MSRAPIRHLPINCFLSPSLLSSPSSSSSCTSITFDRKFNHPVNNLLPLSLSHLTFGSYFNNNVDFLPPNLTHPTFGYDFNQSVNSLPPSLTHYLPSLLYLSFEFNFQTLVGHYQFPDTLKFLILIVNILMESLKSYLLLQLISLYIMLCIPFLSLLLSLIWSFGIWDCF